MCSHAVPSPWHLRERAVFLWMNKTSEEVQFAILDLDSAHSPRRARRREQADMFEVFLRKKKIPSSFESERRFSGTKWYRYPYNQTDPAGDMGCLVPFLLPLSSFLPLKICSSCLMNSLLSPTTGKQVNRKALQRRLCCLCDNLLQAVLQHHPDDSILYFYISNV